MRLNITRRVILQQQDYTKCKSEYSENIGMEIDIGNSTLASLKKSLFKALSSAIKTRLIKY